MKTKLSYCALLLLLTASLSAQPNCSANPTGLVPINDLGTGISPVTGLMGGLYPGGSNFLPSVHQSAGLQKASEISCLDANGRPDAANGRIVWLSIGMSNCTQETQQFMRQANAFSGKNPRLTLVDGAQGGQTAQVISAPWHSNYNNFWNTVGNRLAAAGVTAQQVQVIWLKEANQVGNTAVKPYYDSLVVQFKRIANELKTRFPNVKLCYIASRISARYATTTLNPEPHSYWTGWAVKRVIEDQINGDPQLAFSGSDAKAPWLSWGIYMWSDGSTPQVSNPDIFFNCPADFQNDGTHPSTAGAQKVGGLLLKFFSSDSTASPWFTGTGCSTTVNTQNSEQGLFTIHPNPASDHLAIKFPGPSAGSMYLYLFDLFGKQVMQQEIPGGAESAVLDFSSLGEGVYFLRQEANGRTLSTAKILIAK